MLSLTSEDGGEMLLHFPFFFFFFSFLAEFPGDFPLFFYFFFFEGDVADVSDN